MKKKNIKIALQIFLTLLIIFILAYTVRRNYNEINKYTFKINIPSIVVSFLFLFAANITMAINWHIITKYNRCNISLPVAIRLRLISEIGKYIPGRVLGYGYLIIKYKEAGEEQIKVMSSSFYELFLSTFSAFLFFVANLLFKSFYVLDEYKIVFFGSSLLGFILIHPAFFRRLSYLFGKILKKNIEIFSISYLDVIKILLLYFIYWIIITFAFFYFVKSFISVDFENIGYLSGAFALSTLAGFLAFFVPAGLGAREGMMIYLLGFTTGNFFAIIISVSSRIWIIIGDFVLFLIVLFSSVFNKKVLST